MQWFLCPLAENSLQRFEPGEIGEKSMVKLVKSELGETNWSDLQVRRSLQHDQK